MSLLDYDNAEALAKYITKDIGNRYPASPRSDMTLDWLMNKLKEYGYEPYIQEFTSYATATGVSANAFYNNGIIWIGDKHYTFFGPAYNANTVYKYNSRADKNINGAVLLDWVLSSGDLTVSSIDYTNKAVFITMDRNTPNNAAAAATMPTAARVYNAVVDLQSRGAAAVMFQTPPYRINPTNGAIGDTTYTRIANTAPDANTNSVDITIPIGTTLHYETNGMVQSLNNSTNLKLNMYTNNVGRNVLAVLPSATGSKKTVYMTAHYDTTSSGPGMNDNGSGAIMQLEMARAWRNVKFKHNVVFFFCDMEEVGLRGARSFCTEMTDDDRENFLANYNMDMISTSQADCVHFFLNISDTRLQTLEGPLTATQRLINVPQAVDIAKEYDIFNHSYLAGLKTGFDMNYFNICYDTTTDHYAFVIEATRAGNNFPNMRNAVEYDWRRNEKGTSFETLYHKAGDTFEINFSRERLEKAGDLVAIATYLSAEGFGFVTKAEQITSKVFGGSLPRGAGFDANDKYTPSPVSFLDTGVLLRKSNIGEWNVKKIEPSSGAGWTSEITAEGNLVVKFTNKVVNQIVTVTVEKGTGSTLETFDFDIKFSGDMNIIGCNAIQAALAILAACALLIIRKRN